jgi:TonB family protein
MPKPLRSEIRNPPNRQFAHFGVLDTGEQNKSAFFGSIVFNVILALIAIIIGASVKKTVDDRKKLELTYAEIKPIPKPEPPKPKIVPPKPTPKVEPPKIEPPKIEPPKIEPPKVEPPKPVPVPVQPKPVPAPTPVQPKLQPVTLAAKLQPAANAPAVTNVNLPGQSAALKNNSTVAPTAVQMGHMDSAVPNLKGPSVSAINMGAGMSGGASSPGVGKPSAVNLAGNGGPTGKIGGTAPVAVTGLVHGSTSGTGLVTAKAVAPVQIGQVQAPPPPAARAISTAAGHGPQVTFKPKPLYTAEATAAHIEGSVVVNIKVSASGAVTVLSISKSLGHGLDESARQCAAAIRFKPATDAAGNPIEWEGPVTISFQIA